MSTTFEVPPAQFIRLDLFPALLIGDNLPNAQPGNVLDARRIIITDTHVLLFADSNVGPVLAHEWPLIDIEGRNTIGWTTTVEHEGQPLTFLVKRSSGCGCGSRLRGIFPYPGVPIQPAG